MPSDLRNSIMVEAMGLIFFAFQNRFSSRGAFWHTAICKMYSSSVSSFVCHLSLLTKKSVDLAVSRNGLIIRTFHCGYFDWGDALCVMVQT